MLSPRLVSDACGCLVSLCVRMCGACSLLLFFNGPATPAIDTYGRTLSLHDPLPILIPSLILPGASGPKRAITRPGSGQRKRPEKAAGGAMALVTRSEEHTSELPALLRNASAGFCSKNKQAGVHPHRHHSTTPAPTTLLGGKPKKRHRTNNHTS